MGGGGMSGNSAHDRVAAVGCIRCNTRFPADMVIDSRGCPLCREDAPANLEIYYTDEAEAGRSWPPQNGNHHSMWRYDDFLPVSSRHAISLSEGLTPLLSASQIGRRFGIQDLRIKDESRNPTWSHKDRLSTIIVSHARLAGATTLTTCSSGNAGASLAAYAARAGLPCIVLTFEGAAGPMISQIRKYGAMVLPLADKNDRWPTMAEGVSRLGWFGTSPFAAPVVGSHPLGIEGYKTIAYELFEQLGGEVPDWIVLPVAYGDAIAGIWRGFNDLKRLGLTNRLPKLGAAEIYGSLQQSMSSPSDRLIKAHAHEDTAAVSIGSLQSAFQALRTLRESGGAAVTVSNAELFSAQEELASMEGLFGELSSVAPLAAIRKLRHEDAIAAADCVVMLMSASGLKDLDYSTCEAIDYPPLEGGLDAACRYLTDHYRFSIEDHAAAL